MSAGVYFANAAELLELQSPHVHRRADHRADEERIGNRAGARASTIGKLDPVIQRALETAPQDGQKLMAWKVPTLAAGFANGWSMNTDTMGVLRPTII